jgi:hypothetical protein
MKKNQNMLVWLSKMVFAQHFPVQDTEAGKKAEPNKTISSSGGA